MAIPKISKDNIAEALKYIDEKGIPFHNQSTKYELITDDGKQYPPKYVIAVAAHMANGTDISTVGFNAIEAKNYLKRLGFTIETNQQIKYKLCITSDNVESTDERFTMDDLTLGNNYEPLDVYFETVTGKIVRRSRNKREKNITNQTMPRIACQVFEKQLASLPVEEKESFPVCRYSHDSKMIRGIFPSVAEFKKYRNTLEFFSYRYDNDRQFVIYCWNIFSTIIFVQECLKRFGNTGDKFMLTYRDKAKKDIDVTNKEIGKQSDLVQQHGEYKNSYSHMLIASKNLILRGAPGTGKSYLAKEIATDIISNGSSDNYDSLSDEQKKQVEFVQFHPSYDYSDFVEGLRPKIYADGTMGFELRDGIFKTFVARARKNYEDSRKPQKILENESSVQEAMEQFFSNIELGVTSFKTINGNKFVVTEVDDKYIYIAIPGNATSNQLSLNIDELRKLLEADQIFNKVKDVTQFLKKSVSTQAHSYDYVLYNEINKIKRNVSHIKVQQEALKKYIFIIDEINRGEISKIFGELFYSIDPGYRGKAGEISTQYANMHADPDEKFYIPENVYIIGTMNDIDRSVDSFDFAMRRRFRFVELNAASRIEMLESLNDQKLKNEAIVRMTALNNEIANIEGLNENYQIGAAYFLKLKNISFDKLWTDYLYPLLQEYVRGIYDDKGILNRLAKAYGYTPSRDTANETVKN